MKTLVLLWDPENPQVPVAPVIEALQASRSLHVLSLTFQDVAHPTLPNGSFSLRQALGQIAPDAVLWIEGGPLPSDLAALPCRKACWLLNTHLEPTLLDDLGPQFDIVFSASLKDAANERARWLALSVTGSDVPPPPPGVSILVDDPSSPRQIEIEQKIRSWVAADADGRSVVVAVGSGGQPHPMLFDALGSGAAVLVDSESDLRGIAYPGEHVEVVPPDADWAALVGQLTRDVDRARRLGDRGREIVEHLHLPAHRARELCRGIWPEHRVLSGREFRPRISILVTCYRYLRRFSICLESLARQELPAGALEVVVVDPKSPDGLEAHLLAFAGRTPGIRLVHLPLDEKYHRNRGVAINRAFDASSGKVVIGIDGDLVFPPDLIPFLEARVLESPNEVYGVSRSFVPREETERILTGHLDPWAEFGRLAESRGDGEENCFVGVLGYCQAVHRSAFARARYPEELDMVNQSDIAFVERLKRRAGVSPRFLEDRTVLHLWHPRNWQGTSEFL
jgi:GT2 family glycosyltransferase